MSLVSEGQGAKPALAHCTGRAPDTCYVSDPQREAQAGSCGHRYPAGPSAEVWGSQSSGGCRKGPGREAERAQGRPRVLRTLRTEPGSGRQGGCSASRSLLSAVRAETRECELIWELGVGPGDFQSRFCPGRLLTSGMHPSPCPRTSYLSGHLSLISSASLPVVPWSLGR